MKLHPFHECLRDADKLIRNGTNIYQQFNCANCGIKQTMDVVNTFYKTGKCQECGHVTNIEQDGCNYMVVWCYDQ